MIKLYPLVDDLLRPLVQVAMPRPDGVARAGARRAPWGAPRP
jgi:hypothetical protein